MLIGLAFGGYASQRLLTSSKVKSPVPVLFPCAKEDVLPGLWVTGPESGLTGTEKWPQPGMNQEKPTLPFQLCEKQEYRSRTDTKSPPFKKHHPRPSKFHLLSFTSQLNFDWVVVDV